MGVRQSTNGRFDVTLDIMITQGFEITDKFIPITTQGFNQEYVYDQRMNMAIPKASYSKYSSIDMYVNYVKSYCTYVNKNPKCKPAYLTACGFIPVGIEPANMCGVINENFIIPELQERGIDYFLVPPMSPVIYSWEPYKLAAVSYDVWVNKIDAAKMIKKPVHNITTIDMLKELNLCK